MPLDSLEGLHLLQELIAGYQEPEFQQKLADIYYRYGDDEEVPALLRARRELTMTVQAHVLPKYGFEASHAGVHRSWVEYQKPPLIFDVEIGKCNLLIDYLIRRNPMARARDLKVQEAAEAKRKRLMDKRQSVLSLSDGMSLLDELIAGYQDPDFQRAQMLINKLFFGLDDRRDFIRSQRALCMTVQFPVIPKYGFEASQAGVHKSYMAFQVSELDEDTDIQRRNKLVGYLVHRCPEERATEMLVRQQLAEDEEEPPADQRRRGLPLAPWHAEDDASLASGPSSQALPPAEGCRFCLAAASLLGTDPGLAPQPSEAECARALKGSSWESLSVAKFFPPPVGTPPLPLLCMAQEEAGAIAHEMGLEGSSGWRVSPVARLVLEALEEQRDAGRVLELAAGTGVVGLSLAWRGVVGAESVLTDGDPTCVQLLRANVVLVGLGVSSSLLELGECAQGHFDTVIASDALRDPASPGQPLVAPEQPWKLLDTAEAALQGPEGGRLVVGHQHRHPALAEALLTEAARRGAVVREVLSDWVADPEVGGHLVRVSVYYLEYCGYWRLPGGSLPAWQVEVPEAVWDQGQSGMVQHQVSNYTRFDRHPEIFAALKEILNAAREESWELRILSFGCSDGSECRTMRMYFPEAAIDGLDVDTELIRRNREQNNDREIRYFKDLRELQDGAYDAVLMMTVLCRYGDADTDRLPFEVFDQTLAAMDRYVRLNGYFVIYNANYLFSSSSIACRYENVAAHPRGDVDGSRYSFESGFVTKFTPAGKKISTDGAEHPWVFFQKRSAVGLVGAGPVGVAGVEGAMAASCLVGDWLCREGCSVLGFRISTADDGESDAKDTLRIEVCTEGWQDSGSLKRHGAHLEVAIGHGGAFFAMQLRLAGSDSISLCCKSEESAHWSESKVACRVPTVEQAQGGAASAAESALAEEAASVAVEDEGTESEAARREQTMEQAARDDAVVVRSPSPQVSAKEDEGCSQHESGTDAGAGGVGNVAPNTCGSGVQGGEEAGPSKSAADLSETKARIANLSTAWAALLRRFNVYALAIPARRDHIRDLLARWGFRGATVVDGIRKDTIDLADWEAMGKIRVSTASRQEHGSVLNTGRVACHFGHRLILREFLEGSAAEKELALIFEDDLADRPCEEIQQAMVSFFSELPPSFDILHLGYLWEDEALRQRLGETEVYQTCKAVGRHAYVVTRQTASLLLTETYPQSEAGDQMYIKTIQRHHLKAYQPGVPIFCQDRGAFPISELTGHYRPARNFRPPRDQMKRWNNQSKQSRATAKLRERERRERLAAEEERAQEGRRREVTQQAPQLDAPLSEPLRVALARSYQLTGSWDDWKGFVNLEREGKASSWFVVKVPVGKGRDVEFQVVSDRKWQQRYFPAVGEQSGGIWGPCNGGHGLNWRVPAPEHPSLICVRWNPTGLRSLTMTIEER